MRLLKTITMIINFFLTYLFIVILFNLSISIPPFLLIVALLSIVIAAFAEERDTIEEEEVNSNSYLL